MQLKEHYPIINSLRGLAALMVCAVHFSTFNEGAHGRLFEESNFIYQLGQHGYLGVFIFFVVSGFVIPLSMEKHQYHLQKLHRFLLRRWIRIEFPYLIAILLVILVSVLVAFKNHQTYQLEWARLGHHISYTTTFFGYEWYSPIYWTLAIEMQFYLLIAILFILIQQKSQYLNYAIVILFASTSLLLTDIRLLFHYAPMFSQGILLYLILKGDKKYYLTGFVCTLACGILTGYTANWSVALATLLTSLCIGFIQLDWKLGNFLGKISFSLYLTHGIAINLLYMFANKANTLLLKISLFFAVFLVAIGMAYLFWKFVEQLSQRLSKKVKI